MCLLFLLPVILWQYADSNGTTSQVVFSLPGTTTEAIVIPHLAAMHSGAADGATSSSTSTSAAYYAAGLALEETQGFRPCV
ncbi:hypothetical protein BD289DRAFT_106545 [Coniella lustricola]|uniref:Uncharacterized protein n=1 Tax=Coniella lustricola TaxID=2025994 RepID=A0A2T2ZXL1_9PEZI|nr:hypothetical protein BD289DRAFT_106545 [Coniella lustricola]